jgi:hypothetical protein
LRSKDEVLECFKMFQKMVETQFEKKVKVLRSDNGTKYTNRAMLSSYEIIALYIKLRV